jgi:hypothetical protein
MQYQGTELELFANVVNWKKYWSALIPINSSSSALEVGSGIGSNVNFLVSKSNNLSLLEPDYNFYNNFLVLISESNHKISVMNGTISQINPGQTFNMIYYIDVLEHIENDSDELKRIATHLTPGGLLFVLVPAHSLLFSSFDKSVGHFRRYDKKNFRKIVPKELIITDMRYLDSIGAVGSFINKIMGKGSVTLQKVIFWDRYIVPLSRVIDPLLGYRLGKSLVVKLTKME